MAHVRDSSTNLHLLSELLISPLPSASGNERDRGLHETGSRQVHEKAHEICRSLGPDDLDSLGTLAASNHVIMRSFEPLGRIVDAAGNHQAAEWVATAVAKEDARIKYALEFLQQICAALEEGGCPVMVIKSLDHWPDLGSDLDLYTDAHATSVIALMGKRFKAKPTSRSWGDRLANKWNFVVPGLAELVEIHVGRLGQTGEQTALTQSLTGRSRLEQVGAHCFRVPAPEDRIVISTLQRMYRHFYIRLCDIVDNSRLLDACVVDFEYLRSLGSTAGLWDGIATYLTIISDYVKAYRGSGAPLSSLVTESAKFSTDQVRFRRDFLRVSILPHSLRLYATELKNFFLRGDLRNCLRLSLLPCLATAAALEQKITGSDKGIW
jgi:hypothetical protein